MTDKTDPIAHAARLLREAAEEYKSGISVAGVPDWEGEPETKAAYDEHMAAAAALDAMHSGFDAADMATASAQGFRDGVASVAASAGSEPVAWQYRSLPDVGGLWFDCTKERADLRAAHPERWEVRALYTHPSPPEGMVGGWIAIPGALPEPGVPVLLDIGKKYPIRAMWAAKHTVQAADDDTDWGEYVEEDDMYYAPEGWYEWNECEDNHWRVTETPRAWAPLPPTTSAGSGKGE